MKEKILHIHTGNQIRKCLIRCSWIVFLFLSCISHGNTFAGNDPGFEEISVFVNVQDIGGQEIPAIIMGNDVFLSLTDIFDFLRIRNTLSPASDSISGFFIDPKAIFVIDEVNYRITYREKVFQLKPEDMILTESSMYLRSDYLGDIFGLECTFNFRSLSVLLKSKTELPAMREMRLQQMRLNITKLKGEFSADTIIGRKYPLFYFGAADWSINSMQQEGELSTTRMNLGLGGMLAGGELKGILTYNTNDPFLEREQYYLWRYANNDNIFLRQVMAGKISPQSISTIYDPVVGAQFTNTPTYFRKSFGSYTVSDYTQPNWIVELYVNNVLVDYTTADVSGFFKFDVPLIYGTTDIMLRYYGPWGEEVTSQKYFNIPFTFLPDNEYEYRISSGIVEDSTGGLYSQAKMNYGLSRSITIGGGAEYLSSVSKHGLMPFLNTTIRIGSGIIFSGEYIYNVRAKGLLSYNLPCKLQFELNYNKYHDQQEAIINNYNEERRVVAAMPFRFGSISLYTRLTLHQNLVKSVKNNNAELLLSVSAFGANLNITSYAYQLSDAEPCYYSDASLFAALPFGLIFTPNLKYDYTHNNVQSFRMGVEKHILKHGYVTTTWEKNFQAVTSYFQIGWKYDFHFGHFSSTVYQNEGITSVSESANGSILVEPKTGNIDANGNINVGKGGIIFRTFLDVNGNGKHDKDEEVVKNMNVRITAGGIKENKKDGTIMISGLEPYIHYFVQMDGDNFENISWKIKDPTMSIAIDPNMIKLIEVPVVVLGEASGMIYKTEEGKGIGRIKICFLNNDSVCIASTLSESDGYFSYLGFMPGTYTAVIDSEQLNKLRLQAYPEQYKFVIRNSADGDIVDSIEFILDEIK